MIILKNKDGSVMAMTFYGQHAEALASSPDISLVVDAELAGWPENLKSNIESYREVADTALPTEPEFVDAWIDDGKSVYVDMDKARNIHRDRMRQARAPKLSALDVAYQRAHETNADTSEIVAQKQMLRDVTADPAIDAAQTPEELRIVWPSVLVN